jgi:hypothetical protein
LSISAGPPDPAGTRNARPGTAVRAFKPYLGLDYASNMPGEGIVKGNVASSHFGS